MVPDLVAWNGSMLALDSGSFEPLVVRCDLASPMVAPDRSVALDGLLAAAVVRRTGQPLASSAHECAPVEIPVARSVCGRFHLASFAQFEIDARAFGWTNKRFPMREAQGLSKMSRVLESGGVCKSFRIPREYLHVSRLEWYCLGHRALVWEILQDVTAIGKHRSVGRGQVIMGSWRVEPIDLWEGFPVLRDGVPLRPVPLEWPGLGEHEQMYARITYPYWDRSREELCATMPRQW